MARYTPKTSLQQRREILARSQAGETAPQIAAALHISVPTVHKWRRLARRGAPLSPPRGRAPQLPLSTFPPALPAAIRQLRQAHPGWGPVTLLLELRRDPYWQTQPLPSRSRLATFLKAAGLSKPYYRQRPLPTPGRDPPRHPHAEWQMDAQGETLVAGVGPVSVINIVDVRSRVKVESCPALAQRSPDTAAYQRALRRAFTTYGLPDRLSVDHGSAFFDNTTPSPYPTPLHQWLIALGVGVLFTRKRRPTDHAIVERTHQTLYQQAVAGQEYASGADLWAGLDARRAVLNAELPMAVLGRRAPLVAYPEAGQARRAYRPEWEAALLDLGRVEEYLAGGEWFRRANRYGEFWLGQQRYNAGKRWAGQELALRFDRARREVVIRPVGSAEEVRRPIKGLSGETLMGSGAEVARLPGYQLLLPFMQEAEPAKAG